MAKQMKTIQKRVQKLKQSSVALAQHQQLQHQQQVSIILIDLLLPFLVEHPCCLVFRCSFSSYNTNPSRPLLLLQLLLLLLPHSLSSLALRNLPLRNPPLPPPLRLPSLLRPSLPLPLLAHHLQRDDSSAHQGTLQILAPTSSSTERPLNCTKLRPDWAPFQARPCL